MSDDRSSFGPKVYRTYLLILNRLPKIRNNVGREYIVYGFATRRTVRTNQIWAKHIVMRRQCGLFGRFIALDCELQESVGIYLPAERNLIYASTQAVDN